MAVVVEALVHQVGIAPVGVRVPEAGMKKDIGWTPAQFCAPIVKRIYNNTGRSRCILRSEYKKKKKKKKENDTENSQQFLWFRLILNCIGFLKNIGCNTCYCISTRANVEQL